MDLIDPHTFNMMDQDSEGRIIPATSAREIRNLRINEYSKQGVRVGIRGTRRIHNETFDFDTLGDETTVVNPIVIADIKYGALYNGYDIVNVAKNGFSVPLMSNYQTLYGYLGATGFQDKAKENNSLYWLDLTSVTNSSGFSARGVGYRLYNTGLFSGYKQNGRLACINGANIAVFDFTSGLHNASITTSIDKKTGLSLRLIKNTPTASDLLKADGASCDPYFDGEFYYDTVKIGTQVYTRYNIKSQYYTDGSPIPIVTDNSAWAALTTGAMCFYDNNVFNA